MRYFRYETLTEQDRPGKPDTLKIVEITEEEYDTITGNRTYCIDCGKKKKSNIGKKCGSCHKRFNPHLAL